MAMGWQVGIDIGGTFTDVVAVRPATARGCAPPRLRPASMTG